MTLKYVLEHHVAGPLPIPQKSGELDLRLVLLRGALKMLQLAKISPYACAQMVRIIEMLIMGGKNYV
jgi:hypothetical protein